MMGLAFLGRSSSSSCRRTTSMLLWIPQKQTNRSWSSAVLPTRHSRHELAPTCLDRMELDELTDQLLSAKEGSLFSYEQQRQHLQSSSIEMHRQEAWDQANETVQRMEYVIQGHAARIPGSLWNRWTDASSSSSSSPEETDDAVEKMGQLLDRAWLEGAYYMRVRKEHLSQLAWEQGVDLDGTSSTSMEEEEGKDSNPTFPQWNSSNQDEDLLVQEKEAAVTPQEMEQVFRNVQEELKKVVGEEGHLDDDDDDDDVISEEELLEMQEDFMNDDEETTTSTRDLIMDFALPGPSVAMYDAFLDGMAVQETRGENSLSPLAVLQLMVMVLERHRLDGGDANNTNPYTLPTRVTYNAPIRLSAALSEQEDRDEALVCAFSSYNALAHSGLDVNCATYKYLLQVVKTFIPPSRSRGHIVHGLWSHARLKGLLDEEVWEAVRQGHEPSNGNEFDEWLEEYKDKTYMDVDQRWRRRIKVNRQFANETTY